MNRSAEIDDDDEDDHDSIPPGPIYADPPAKRLALHETPEQTAARRERLRRGVEDVLNEAERVPQPTPPRAKPGRKPGAKPKSAIDSFNVDELRKPPPPPVCPLCANEATLLSPEMTRELLRSSRDRLSDVSSEMRGVIAESDLLYVTARLDGFCSLGCWRKGQEK